MIEVNLIKNAWKININGIVPTEKFIRTWIV